MSQTDPSPASKQYKYCETTSINNRDPLEIGWIMWPEDSDDEDESEEGEEEEEADNEADKIENNTKNQDNKDANFIPPRLVTNEGFPITKAGLEKFFSINEEVDKRDQDVHDMYIYNDFSGYGAMEVLENTLAEFNKLIFKKDISPFQKWALVEGLVTYLGLEDHMQLMMNENSSSLQEIFNMLGVMFVTALEMLDESSLIGPNSPLPDNLGLMTIFFLDFMTNTAGDLEIGWTHEIVRAADRYGVVVVPVMQVEGIDQEVLDRLRERCEDGEGLRIEWKDVYPRFKKGHPGGKKYDITKMRRREKAQYMLKDEEEDEE